MTALHRVGDTVPVFLFVAGLTDAIRAARTGHGTFVDLFDVEVDFTIHDHGIDVRIVGLGEDSGELRVVGGTEYIQAARYEQRPDGDVRVHTQWITTEADSGHGRGLGATGIGTPLGLIEGITEAKDVVVVASDERTTTYECEIRTSAIQRAVGENLTGQGYEVEDPGWESRVVVDAAGLPVRVEPLGRDFPFTFGNWGTTPIVTPPDAPIMGMIDWYTSEQFRPPE